jgi:glycosyltransferase involved in cell wall biosynthesis
MVCNTYYPANPRLRRQAEALAAHGYLVEVLCQRPPGSAADEELCGVHVRRIGGIKYRGAGLPAYVVSNVGFFLRVLLTLVRAQIRHGYAAVQVYSMPEALIFAALGPRLAGVPVIYDAGDLTAELFLSKFGRKGGAIVAWLLRMQERLCLRFADLVVTVHEEYARRLRARGVPPERLRIIMNLPDPQLFERALRTPAARNPDEFRLVHHGSLVARYGADLAIRAVARLRDRIPSLRLRVYGDGDFRQHLSGLIEELALADTVALVPGYIPLEQLLPEIAAADVAVVPHRADAFTDTILPNKLLEYLALEMPTLVTRTRTVLGHIPEDTVEYCEPNDVDALARGIERLWAEPDYRRGLSAKARAFTRAHSWKQEAAAFCAAVDELVARNPARPLRSAAARARGPRYNA